MHHRLLHRRDLLKATAAAGALPWLAPRRAAAGEPRQALVAITFDLEMSRNFPRREDTHWDYEKGNLDEATKAYSLAAGRRVKERGGAIHYFVVGRVLEQESVAWLEELVKAGHPAGNHTYDHVNVKAQRPEEAQLRFQRAPWLVHGKTVREVIEDNVRLAALAMKARLGIDPVGFRTPGGFNDGLADRTDLQQMLLAQGYKWVSSKYPAHPLGEPGKEPGEDILRAIVAAQAASQPFRYASGLVEVPMSPVSDVTAFRAGRWQLESFLRAIDAALSWVIEHGAVFDFLAHPSCLGIVDPALRTIDLICDRVAQAGERARIVTLDSLAERASGA
jgi:hypothetical protein